jgi:arginyl-tRNA synthetase
MMSSRTGNVITYEDLRAQLLARAISETKKRRKDWSEQKIKEVASKLVNGAMKFEMIKVSREQVITFNIKEALRFDGFTAAYLQYTYARIKSIIKKSEVRSKKLRINYNNLTEIQEHELIMKLVQYPEAVIKAGANYNPAEIAKYLFELAQEFNNYYHSVPVLKAKEEIRMARLILIGAVSQVISNGLGLLGIEAVEKM